MMIKDGERQTDVFNYSLEEEGQILKLAVAQRNIQVFVYDILLRKLYFFSNNRPVFGILTGNEYSIEEILDKKVIDSAYTYTFSDLFYGIERGEENTSALIQVHGETGTIWEHIILVNCPNRDGKQKRSIGTIQDVSERVETEQRYNREKQYRLAMMRDSRRIYEINVTRDRFIRLETIQDSTDYAGWKPYTESMEELRKTCVCKEDWAAFLEIAVRENLIHSFAQGHTELYCEYRTLDVNGVYNWSSSSTHLLKDPITNDIKGFIYVMDIDKQKKKEIALVQRAELDPLTGIYNRRTIEELINQYLDNTVKGQIHAFLIFDFDDFKYVNDHFGHLKGDYLLKQSALLVGKLLVEDSLFARMGGDEFLVFLINSEEINHIMQIAANISKCVNEICLEEGSSYRPTVSIGIAVYPCHGHNFVDLYKNSDCSLYKAKQQGKNQIVIC